MVWITILLPLVLLIVDLWQERKLYSPAVVFNGIFFVTLFLYNFKFSTIQHDLSSRTLLLLFLCEVGFNLPVFISKYGRKPVELVKYKKQMALGLSPTKEMVIFYVILAMFVVELIYCGGCPLLWKFTGDSRTYMDFGIPSFNGVLHGLITLMGAYSIFKRKCIYKYFYVTLALLMITRQVIISIFVQGLFFYLCRHKLSKKLIITILIGGIIGIVAFSLVGNMRTGEDAFLNVSKFKEEYDWIPTSFRWIYSYMCYSVSNLNMLVGLTDGFVNFGATIFNKLVPSALSFGFVENQEFYYLVSHHFTVSTFAPEIYIDFGLVGITVFCIAMGFIANLLYKKVQEGSELFCLLYMIMCHNIVLLFFTNMFFNLPIMFEIVLIPFVFMIDYKGVAKKATNKFTHKMLKRA